MCRVGKAVVMERLEVGGEPLDSLAVKELEGVMYERPTTCSSVGGVQKYTLRMT